MPGGGEGAWRAGAARQGGGVRASRSPAVGRRGRTGVWPMREGHGERRKKKKGFFLYIHTI